MTSTRRARDIFEAAVDLPADNQSVFVGTLFHQTAIETTVPSEILSACGGWIMFYLVGPSLSVFIYEKPRGRARGRRER